METLDHTATGGRTSAPRATAPTASARNLAQIAMFAGLIAVLGLPGAIPVMGMAVPVTAQTLGVMLAGAILGPWRGAAAVIVFNTVVAMGLPLLAGGRGGLGVFFGPSAGYLVGWVVGAAVIGLMVHGLRRTGRTRPTWPRVLLGCLLGGIVAIYALGIPVQALVTGLGLQETALLAAAFLPGDLLKVLLATLVTLSLRRAYPQAFDR
ncbi:biotin transporter BioY [Nesterenkonia xinjiangensis]|uniref:Biotin transporter n=1 Tax=Nesterenkonia xinjiangensis TaxID=225327 RepID=A0A7Z0GPG1_9MICC|nr:biotin transport system substrate-specific component [Nesterenkonia xinjiangensis]